MLLAGRVVSAPGSEYPPPLRCGGSDKTLDGERGGSEYRPPLRCATILLVLALVASKRLSTGISSHPGREGMAVATGINGDKLRVSPPPAVWSVLSETTCFLPTEITVQVDGEGYTF